MSRSRAAALLPALLCLCAATSLQAQRPILSRPVQRPPVVASPRQPPARVNLDALRDRVRNTPRIAPLSTQERLERVRTLSGDPNVTLDTTSVELSFTSPAALGIGLYIRDAHAVVMPDGYAIAQERDTSVDFRFPDGFTGRYLFDCYVSSGTISWSHAGQQGQVPVADGHAMFVVDVNPGYWLQTSIPGGGFHIWHKCEMTRIG